MDSRISFRKSWCGVIRPQVLAAAMLCLIGFAGCGPKLVVTNEDASFGTAETYTRPVAVGGIVWNAGKVEREPEVCAILEAELWERLTKDIDSSRVKELQWVSQHLDSADRSHVLTSLKATGGIDSVGCDRLHYSLPDSSVLIVFGRVLYDTIDTTRHYASSEKEKDYDDIKRSVRMSLLVFDMARGRTVWQAEVSNQKSRTEDSDNSGFNLGGALALLGVAALASIIFDDDEKEPPPVFTSSPELTKIVWGLYGQLSKNLVGKKKT